MENKDKILELIKTNTPQNLFLALTLWKGLGFEVEEVLEWWWEDQFWVDASYHTIQNDFIHLTIHAGDTLTLYTNKYHNFAKASLERAMWLPYLPSLPIIIKNIKDYTFALILHLWEFGEEMVE